MIAKENKIILKKDKEAKKLEALEVEVLKRLRDTHIMQQQALEDIQYIFENRKRLSVQPPQDTPFNPNLIGQHQNFSNEFKALSEIGGQEDEFIAENMSSMKENQSLAENTEDGQKMRIESFVTNKPD